MIGTEKTLTQKKNLQEKPVRKQLISRWKIVDGKLVCQWFTEEV
jgi:hypothetical protein